MCNKAEPGTYHVEIVSTLARHYKVRKGFISNASNSEGLLGNGVETYRGYNHHRDICRLDRYRQSEPGRYHRHRLPGDPIATSQQRSTS
jgi:hypothetical protein